MFFSSMYYNYNNKIHSKHASQFILYNNFLFILYFNRYM